MRVKDLADLAGTTVRAVRYYHQLGLLSVPDPGTTTWRSYGFTHFTRLMRIRWLVDSGVPLAEVQHLLRAPEGADERTAVIDDLSTVLASIDAKVAVLTEQRARVTTLLDRVRTTGQLSPLPDPLARLYAALLERPLPPAMGEAIQRERELLEIACYWGSVPHDVVLLVESLGESDIDELCRWWARCYDIDRAAGGRQLTPELQGCVEEVVARVVDLADRVASEPTHRLLARAAELDTPPVRAAVNLAYPSPTYRQVVTSVVTLARQRSLT